MILVADCSPLIALASCNGLHLLDALFDTVIVPEAVCGWPGAFSTHTQESC